MTFPKVRHVRSSGAGSTANQTYDISLPDRVSGDVLIMTIATPIAERDAANWVQVPAGWELVTRDPGVVFKRLTDNAEGDTVTVTIAEAVSRIMVSVYSVYDFAAYADVAGLFQTGLTPPSVNPGWGEGEHLWLASLSSKDGTANFDLPNGFFDKELRGTASTVNAFHCTLVSGRASIAAEILTPSAFVQTSSSGGVFRAGLIAIRGSATAPPEPVPVAFTGTAPTLNGTVGEAFSDSLTSYFSGTETPFVYSVQSGTLPAGLSLNTSTGVISGTPTTAGTASGLVLRATDTDAATADTNAFSIVIAAAPTAPADAPTSLAAVAQSETVILVTYGAVTGATGYEVEIDSGVPIDVGNVLSFEHTGLTAGTTYSYRVRAYNAVGPGPYATAVTETTNATTALAWDISPAISARTTTSYTITATPSAPCTVYAVAVLAGSATPTNAQIVAGQNASGTAALAGASEVSVGAEVTLTLSGLGANPTHDIHAVGYEP